MAYGEHGGGHDPSISDLILGIELGAGWTGHSVSIADATAAAIAFQMAFGHNGEAHAHASIDPNYSVGVPLGGSAHAPDGGYAGGGTSSLRLPGSANNATAVFVVRAAHARCDPSPAEKLQSLAEAARLEGCVPSQAPTYVPHLLAIDRTEPRILGQPSSGDGQKPQGGTTRIWRQFYRTRSPGFLLFRRRETLDSCRTFLVVTGVTWRYRGREHYETRAAFTVYSLPFVVRGSWTYAKAQIDAYRSLGESLAREFERFLARYPVARPADPSRRGSL